MKNKTNLVVVDLNKVKDPFGVLKGATPFPTAVRELIGEDENEIQDMERQLYFVGKNDLRHQILKKVEDR